MPYVCQIIEASGNLLNIIGSCDIFVKIPFIKTIKRLECLVLRGNFVDREILVSCETLKNWDLIHSTFGRETVTSFINRCNTTHYKSNNSRQMKNKVRNVKNLSQLYSKSQIPTDDLLEEVSPECVKLREKSFKDSPKNF